MDLFGCRFGAEIQHSETFRCFYKGFGIAQISWKDLGRRLKAMEISAWNVEVVYTRVARYLLVAEMTKYSFCVPQLNVH